ncbi:hypothetical protein CERSUDRAFT_127428 [Gelatoporia subvermispora B]|uniref:F-box domain-containing protein n=1 Tax=Ceriporiopsis subvermispora (strain B) TaxID=914234 RepID=M2Q3Q9_CERS8|nr:hypothetical protein CERSUDRAFT_127428 [Gelatoporia subvermispora B]
MLIFKRFAGTLRRLEVAQVTFERSSVPFTHMHHLSLRPWSGIALNTNDLIFSFPNITLLELDIMGDFRSLGHEEAWHKMRLTNQQTRNHWPTLRSVRSIALVLYSLALDCDVSLLRTRIDEAEDIELFSVLVTEIRPATLHIDIDFGKSVTLHQVGGLFTNATTVVVMVLKVYMECDAGVTGSHIVNTLCEMLRPLHVQTLRLSFQWRSESPESDHYFKLLDPSELSGRLFRFVPSLRHITLLREVSGDA